MPNCQNCSIEISESEAERQTGICASCAIQVVSGNTEVLPQYNTFFKRSCAIFVDSAVLGSVYALADWVLRLEISVALNFSIQIFFCFLVLLYAPVMHSCLGQTLGKLALRVKVFDLDETSLISLKRALVRDIVQILRFPFVLYLVYHQLYLSSNEVPSAFLDIRDSLDYLLGIWVLLEIFTMLLNRKRRAIHDFISHSVVINLEHFEQNKMS